MNVRPPLPANPQQLEVQDRFLSTERDERSVIDPRTLPSVAQVFQPVGDSCASRLVLWRGDITTLAFCCISTGEFRFPKERAEIGVQAVRRRLTARLRTPADVYPGRAGHGADELGPVLVEPEVADVPGPVGRRAFSVFGLPFLQVVTRQYSSSLTTAQFCWHKAMKAEA